MIITRLFEEVREACDGTVGLVPTMGFLHEGHVSLLDSARRSNDTVVMSLFVNPLQFGEQTDLDAYPRDLGRDFAIAEDAGVDVVFAPNIDEMYVGEPLTRVVLPEMTKRMEGSHRPGHFGGVATVVTKVFAGIQPDRAYFGRKDAQQLAIIGRMTRDLSFPVTVVPISTLREADGLALSSRNIRLGPKTRPGAAALSGALFHAADRIDQGDQDAVAIAADVWDALAACNRVEPEYAEWAVRHDLSEPDIVSGGTFLALAARVGGVRLIDNIHVDEIDERLVADRGVRIAETSMLYDEGDE